MGRSSEQKYCLNIQALEKELELSNRDMGVRLLMPVSSYVTFKKCGFVTLRVLKKFYNAFGQKTVRKYMMEDENGK